MHMFIYIFYLILSEHQILFVELVQCITYNTPVSLMGTTNRQNFRTNAITLCPIQNHRDHFDSVGSSRNSSYALCEVGYRSPPAFSPLHDASDWCHKLQQSLDLEKIQVHQVEKDCLEDNKMGGAGCWWHQCWDLQHRSE